MAEIITNSESTPPRYTKAPGNGRHAMGTVSLWFGDQDLLQVTATPGKESYERMPYANIQAVLMTRTTAWGTRLIVWAVITVLALLISVACSVGTVELLFIMALPLLLLFVEFVRGPTCECYVLTGVERYRLYPWRRKRAAMKGIRLLAARTRAAQK